MAVSPLTAQLVAKSSSAQMLAQVLVQAQFEHLCMTAPHATTVLDHQLPTPYLCLWHALDEASFAPYQVFCAELLCTYNLWLHSTHELQGFTDLFTIREIYVRSMCSLLGPP